MITANGSNTTTIRIIIHVTACSSIELSGAVPYKKAAMYLIGPTSASTFRTSAATGALSSLSCDILFCDSVISWLIRLRSFCWAFRIATALSAPFSSCERAITWSTPSSSCLRILRFASIFSFSVRIFSSYIAILLATSPLTKL